MYTKFGKRVLPVARDKKNRNALCNRPSYLLSDKIVQIYFQYSKVYWAELEIDFSVAYLWNDMIFESIREMEGGGKNWGVIDDHAKVNLFLGTPVLSCFERSLGSPRTLIIAWYLTPTNLLQPKLAG